MDEHERRAQLMMSISEGEYEDMCDAIKGHEEHIERLRKQLAYYRTDEVFMDLEKALTQIWEMDPDEPYDETIRVMQQIALGALKKAGCTLDTQ